MNSDYENLIASTFSVDNTQGVSISVNKPKERLDENYTNKDLNWNIGTYSGDIYISTPNDTHNLIVNHYNDPANKDYYLPGSGYPGTSGFFTNEETASQSFTSDGSFNSVKLGHELQQAPHYDKNAERMCERLGQDYSPQYNSHLDCFHVNPEKMQENYGTSDLYAAMGSCCENTAWGDGGGFQGYNPKINEMINNGSLEYVPEKSRYCENNLCLDYSDRKSQARNEAKAVNDYIENNGISGGKGERLGYNELPMAYSQSDTQTSGAPPKDPQKPQFDSMYSSGEPPPSIKNNQFNPEDYIPHSNSSGSSSKSLGIGMQ